MPLMQQIGELKIRPNDIILVASVHNEASLLPEFLNHYRKLAEGNISFLIVEDYSTDESTDLLSTQPDVTLYRPITPKMFASHYRKWRTYLLNLHGNGKWCLSSDIDEHLVYRDTEAKSLHRLINEMERERANALPAVMIDMYGDRLLSDHAYGGSGLKEEFPLFDALSSYRARSYKDGSILMLGGPRHRLFYPDLLENSRERYERYTPVSSSHFSRPKRDGFLYRLGTSIRKRLRRLEGGAPLIDGVPHLNVFKTPLFLWSNGMEWTPHGIKSFPMSALHGELAVLLHYHLARGFSHLEYVADRHPARKNHHHIATSHDWSRINPVCEISRTYINNSSIFGKD